MGLPKKLTILIPVYNEEQRFSNYFRNIVSFYEKHMQWEVVYVDDGSTDQTKLVINRAIQSYSRMRLLSYSVNQGKGFAVKQGILAAKQPNILITDIDLSTPLENLEDLYKYFKKGYSFVLGSRRCLGSKILIHQSLFRELLGRGFTWLSNLVLGLSISDFTCGFKLISRSTALDLINSQKIKRWVFDVELIYLAKKKKYQLKECPVTWSNDFHTKVGLSKDIFTSLIDLFRIALLHSLLYKKMSNYFS